MKSKVQFNLLLVGGVLLAAAVLLGVALTGSVAAQGPAPAGETSIQTTMGTAFTYQGYLEDGGSPVNNTCDFKFSLYDAVGGGRQVAATQTKTNISVTDGRFTVSPDFGASVFEGSGRWLGVEVRCPAARGSYTALNPRQELTAVPYALGLQPGTTISGTGAVLTAQSSNGIGMMGIAYGVTPTTTAGVFGLASATYGATYGVHGQSDSTSGYGVYGEAPGIGMMGIAYGVTPTTTAGVFGLASATYGANYGVYGKTNSPSGYAGYFSGKVHVTGDFSVGGTKSFKIDHPLDPQNKYLYHYNVESSEVVNQYTGNVTLDADGAAWVQLPDWFEALNRDFRYQLTPIGGWAPLYIAQKIADNRFQIAGGEREMEVSWMVTALRNDPYLRQNPHPEVVDKPADEKGTYLYPEGYGQPKEMGLDYQRNAERQTMNDE